MSATTVDADVLIARNPCDRRADRADRKDAARRRRGDRRPRPIGPGRLVGDLLARTIRRARSLAARDRPRRRRLGPGDPRRGRQADGRGPRRGHRLARRHPLDGPARPESPGRRAARPRPAAVAARADRPTPLAAVGRDRDGRDVELPAPAQCAADRPGRLRGQRGGLEAVGAGPGAGAEARREPRGGRAARGPGRDGAGGRRGRGGAAWRRGSTRASSRAGSRTAGESSGSWGAGASRPSPSCPASTPRSSHPTPRSSRRPTPWRGPRSWARGRRAWPRSESSSSATRCPGPRPSRGGRRPCAWAIPRRGDIDVGPMISESARARFDASIRGGRGGGGAAARGGAALDGPGWFYVADGPARPRCRARDRAGRLLRAGRRGAGGGLGG